MLAKGRGRVDKRTKDLVKRLQPGEIAIINHRDIDEVAAESLIECKIKAVINADESISGTYPNLGPQALVDAGIILVDKVGKDILEKISEGEEVTIDDDGMVRLGDQVVGWGKILSREIVKEKMEETKKNLSIVLESFVQNTITYAQQEQGLILGEVTIPEVGTEFAGRHTLIVVRGQNYKEDLLAIKSYITEVKPILIGVDGGADALLDFGYQPDMIIGDMDSVSDRALACGAELVVHAYRDGRAPGLERVHHLGLEAKIFPAPGTSEDIAMLLAYEKGTDLIVAVGTHSNLIDFLEKGRKGMASTFLVRMKVGSILVDAKGVNKLYQHRMKASYMFELLGAAAVAFGVVMMVTPSLRQLLRLLYLQFRMVLGL